MGTAKRVSTIKVVEVPKEVIITSKEIIRSYEVKTPSGLTINIELTSIGRAEGVNVIKGRNVLWEEKDFLENAFNLTEARFDELVSLVKMIRAKHK